MAGREKKYDRGNLKKVTKHLTANNYISHNYDEIQKKEYSTFHNNEKDF